MGYKDSILQIRKARTSRDQVNDELYKLQLKYLRLSTAQKQFDRNEVLYSKEVQDKINELRNQIAELSAKIKALEMEMTRLRSYKQLVKEKEGLISQIKSEISRLEIIIQNIDAALQSNNIRPEERKELEIQKAKVLSQLEGLKGKLQSLAQDIEELNAAIRTIPTEDRLQRDIEEQANIKSTLDLKLQEIIKETTSHAPDQRQELDNLKARIKSQKAVVGEHTRLVDALKDKLYDPRTPVQMIEEWNDNLPIMLFPVRLETRFKSEGRINQLWVRVYPDDIAVTTHEPVLTDKEVSFGKAHWIAIWKAKENQDKKIAAWELITKQFGVNRSAWVALQTRPANWVNADLLTNEEQLQFPDITETKTSSWTKAPYTKILPDKFVLIPLIAGKMLTPLIGNPIKDIVITGPSPMEEPDTPSISRDETDKRIHLGQDFDWVKDFDKAVNEGMGFKLDLTNETINGFDQLVVLGVKITSDEENGKALIEELFNNHKYSEEGLSLIPQGTPTNNTEEVDAGYSLHQTVEDIRKRIEKNDVLFTPVSDVREATDGQRLADLLGLEYDVFQSVLNSDLKEHMEAVAMNKALYGGTLGYYLNSMLNEVLEGKEEQLLRHHFTNYVTGRGPLPSLRIGNQPYGIIVTSQFSSWKYNRRLLEKEGTFPFYTTLHRFLSYLQEEWNKHTGTLASISKESNAGESLMKILGLHPNSVELFQRVGYSFDYLKNLEQFTGGGKYVEDVFNMVMEGIFARQILKNFGYNSNNPDGSAKPNPLLLQLIFQHYHSQLDNKNLIHSHPLSEDVPNGLNYIQWLIDNSSNSKKLETQDFGEANPPTALLYMMLRNSLLMETSNSIFKYLNKNAITAKELIRSRKFMNITTTPSVTHWEIFQAPVNKLITTEISALPLYKFIHTKINTSGESDVVYNMEEQLWGLEKLKALSTAALERALIEHIDLLSYRLDAWQTSLFYQRLQDQRNVTDTNTTRNKGLYIGAYGYLENVRPNKNKRIKISEQVLPEVLREQKENLYIETDNGGYVHAPTLNHATAAALLRNGYLTHADPANREMLSVNLSSERVRRAKHIIDGIRNGQSLEVLLGYQFERGLHDWTTRPVNPVILNHLLPDFRNAFPITKTKVPQEGKVTGPETTTQEFYVMNGLALANIKTPYPYGITTLPSSLTTDQINAIKQEKDNLENTLDALRDVLTAEASYQLAMGNFERAAAVMQCISAGTIPPEIEVINSARGTDLSITNKVVIHFDPTLITNPWTGVPLTTRAITEPGLNHWLGMLLGDPSKIRCKVMAVDAEGNILTRPDLTPLEAFISLEVLQIQPIDFIYLIKNKLEESGTSELEYRIRYLFAQANSLSDTTIVKIEFATIDAPADLSVKSFAEILGFANYLRELITSSKTLVASDFEPASKELITSDDNPNNLDIPELLSRVSNVFTVIQNHVNEVMTATEDAETLRTEVIINTLRSKLQALADQGFVYAFPQSSHGFEDAQIEILVNQGRSISERFTNIEKEYNKKLTLVNDATTAPNQKASLLSEMIKLLIGDNFVLIPHFTFNNTADIAQAYSNKNSLLTYVRTTLNRPLPVNEWLHGISLVRPKMYALGMIRMINDSFNDTPLEGAPIQLPYKSNDTWLAVEFPSGTQIDHDTLSIIQYTPQGFDATKAQSGLLLDEWVEAIPNKEEVTGITFNYNQPNSVPPQAILIAVTPEEKGYWRWDDLVRTILDTVDRAKRRAIEPDSIDKMNGISTLLPAVLSEFSTSKSGISLDYALNIKQVYTEVANLNLINP